MRAFGVYIGEALACIVWSASEAREERARIARQNPGARVTWREERS